MTAAAHTARFNWRALVLPGALLAAWEIAVGSGLLQSTLAPSLEQIVQRGWSELADGRLGADIAASLRRDLLGWLAGSAAGVAAGFLLGTSRWSDALLSPSVNAVKQIALLAWIPLMSVWFGVGENAKLAFIAFAAFMPAALNTREGALQVQAQHAELAKVLLLGRWQAFRHIVFPTALPSILTGLRLALIYAWLATVGAEYFMTAGPGLGGLMTEGRERSQMDLVLLGVVLLGGIGFLLNSVFSQAAGLLMRRWPR